MSDQIVSFLTLGCLELPCQTLHFHYRMVTTLSYDVISRNVEEFGSAGSPFVTFSINAFAIIPAIIVLVLFQDKIGRKAMSSLAFLVCALCTLFTGITMVLVDGVKYIIFMKFLSFISRCAVALAYDAAAQCMYCFRAFFKITSC